MSKIEIACFNEASALIAIQENVDRIELCEDYSLGGITPNIETLQRLEAKTNIPIFVMIRPRGGDFFYNEKEFEQMKSDLMMLKEVGADGFVFGILDENNQLDFDRNLDLINHAGAIPCTFHRAFDRIENQQQALEDVIKCGFKTILTSGGKASAMQGLENLKKLKTLANNRINILVGGGVRSENVDILKQDFDYLHSACISKDSEEIDIQELRKLLQEF